MLVKLVKFLILFSLSLPAIAWDSSKGWAIQIKEKDWSSSEGDHWDEVLEKTYCK